MTSADTDTRPDAGSTTAGDTEHGTAPLLTVEHLRVTYGERAAAREVVRDVSFSVPAGSTLALIGESGSGKSTIARAVLRLLERRGARVEGSVRLRGREISRLREHALRPLRGRVLGFVPQDPGSALNPVRTIGSQALEAAALVPEARSRAAREALVREGLERAGLTDPERIAASYPHQLSGGQLQRVLIALAIIPGPALLVADEPTSALDVTVQKQILDLLTSLQDELGIGLLLITHDLALAAERSQQVVVLSGGTIQEAGPTAEVFAHPRSEYTRRLQADVPGLHPDRFADLRAARDLGEGGGAPPATAPRVTARDITRTFRSTGGHEIRALHGVSFSIARGTTHALVGESGSGKTTAARALLGLERLDAGALEVDGRTVDPSDPRALRALRRDLQLVHQNPFTSLDPRFTVGRIVREPLDMYRVGDAAAREERVSWALAAVRLDEELLGRRPTALSGGQRQRVAIARALVLRPEVLVLDEPTSALDVTVQAGILEVLVRLQKDLGLTYLFISHDLGVVRQVADTLTVLRRGEVVEEGEAVRVFADPQHEYTQRLLASIPAHVAGAERTTRTQSTGSTGSTASTPGDGILEATA
ncbi:ABC transporter ATP-binding protein [Brachybacterium sp. MASK1Z-5]|uniref:ABC transporter ATP-binding protein n=1 Tax=Brachybacterium halotolerans TaxID=2795215 RepID=A0ABS1BD49_9MICO|nr:ABC transporter ATP-binding protein [Brachybacterium halotolerans]MBK0332531.1 ABC transporter ATP-binding protein [Brachybacterium halotolerans]